jgi:hypothetical protein
MVCKWIKLKQSGQTPLARSSHTISVVGQKAYVFGGEHEPRKPINSNIHEYVPPLKADAKECGKLFPYHPGFPGNLVSACTRPRYDFGTGTWITLETNGEKPAAVNGVAAAAVGPVIYFFGGRSGVDMGAGKAIVA